MYSSLVIAYSSPYASKGDEIFEQYSNVPFRLTALTLYCIT